MEPPYIPVPVGAAQAIAERYDKAIVIIFAHDAVHGLMHTTTYGVDAQNKLWAAQGGEIATKALGAYVEAKKDYQDYRMEIAVKLLAVLKDIIKQVDAYPYDSPDLSDAREAVRIADYVIGEWPPMEQNMVETP